MKRTMLAGAVATLTVLAVALGACGADGNPLEDASAEEPDITMPDITMPDLTMPDVPELSMPDLPDLPDVPDFTMPDMPDFSMPALSLPADRIETFEQMIRRMWPNLDDEQVSCLAEGVFELSPDNVFDTDIFEECGIDPEDLGG